MAFSRLVSALASAVLVASSPAWAIGTVAIGLPADVAQGGFAMGITYNYGNAGDADAEALKQCLNFMDAPDSTRALCKVDTHFTNQCFAMAMDPEPGTYGVGYRVGGTQADADTAAMRDCQNTSSADRKSYCRVSYRTCDGTAQ
ncbi:MAG TPA: DUF4189 domain-containing protein [Rhizomicrobium sp.]|nr:DUF4189 domain-containing protein [Rhizomicrobium sp.]